MSPPGQTLRAAPPRIRRVAAIWPRSDSSSASFALIPASSSCASSDLRIQAIEIRDAGGSKIRLYVPGPAVFQVLGLFLRLPPTAADANCCDVPIATSTSALGFDLYWFGG